MFESIAIRRLETEDQPLDIGLLAETLLFYQKAHLLLDRGSLASLLKSVGPDHLQYLLDNKFATAAFYRDTLGVHTKNVVHDFICFELAGTKEEGLFKTKKDKVHHIFERALGESFATKKAANKFIRSVPLKKLSTGFNHEKGIPGLARQDLDDPDYVWEAIDTALKALVPTVRLHQLWHFTIHRIDDGFVIDTNLDFDAINSEYHKYVSPKHSTITPAYLVNYLLQARADICLSSVNQSEFVTTPASSKIVQLKFVNLLEKRFKNVREIELFQEIHLGNAHAIREALNSGEKKFGDFIEILEKSTKFKEWLKDAEPDKTLLREYYNEVTADTWIDKLPTKGVRFALFTGAGMLIDLAVPTGLGTAAGISMSAGDAFILDKFLKGWKPNQFVEGPLTAFVND